MTMRALAISTGLLLALGACEPGSAQQPAPADSAVRLIREHYATIERELPGYRCRVLELQGFSLEGGELRACYAGGQLRKLTAVHYGETFRSEEQFFFWDRQVEFVFRVHVTYAIPFPHAAGVRERAEDRFYFVDGRLVRWLGPGRAPRSGAAPDARGEAAEMLELARRLASCAQDAARTVCAA